MSRLRTALAVALGILYATAAAAQTPTPPPATPAPATTVPPVAISQVPATGKPIVIEAGKGTLIRLSQPAATVFIANPDIADVQVKSPLLIYVSAKSPGETVVYAVDANERVLLNAPVRVDHDLSKVRQSLQALMPGENIGVTSVDKNLVLSGDVTTASRAEKARALAASVAANIKDTQVLNQLSVDTPNQVNLRVKIAEVNRTALKALGFNWSGSWSNNRLDHSTFNFATNNPFTNQGIVNQNLFQYGFGVPGVGSIQATLDALTSEGLITTLAEPNLTATSGQTASFLAGGEFPVPVSGSAGTGGVSTITIEFKQFGVALDFVPTIIDANHLSLRVRPEVSQLTTTGSVSVPLSATATVTIPALTVRFTDGVMPGCAFAPYRAAARSVMLRSEASRTSSISPSRAPSKTGVAQ
jgi:pilus assembly protein CpaC